MAFQFPWTNLHELNLDWFLSKFKQFTNNYLETTATVELIPTTEDPEVTVTGGTLDDDTDIVDPFTFNFKLPINTSGGAVDSVNGQTGTVVLDKTDIGLGNVANVAQYSASNPPPYPVTSVNGDTGAVVLDKTDIGLGNVDNVQQYSVDNPPPYPVTSVNGMTGNVTVTAPVTSVNGMTGDVIVSGGGGSGDVLSVNGKNGVVVLDKTDIGLGNVDNVQQYSATNPPPYPVTSVNGMTGDVIVQGNYAPAIIPTANGAIAHFTDGADDLPISELIVDIAPSQSGSGDPSPSNIRPISGWTGCNVTRTGKNLLPQTNYSTARFTVASDGNVSQNNPSSATFSWLYSNGIMRATLPAGTYTATETVTTASTASGHGVQIYDDSDVRIVAVSGGAKAVGEYSASFTLTKTTNIAVVCKLYYGVAKFSIVAGSTAQSYEPYQDTTLTVDWTTEAGTVYGGTIDVVTGLLTVTNGYIASYNGETLPSTWISDRDVYAPGTTPTTGAEVVYKLATPQTYQLTPQQPFNTWYGVNNIWGNTGDSTVTYTADTMLYIQNLIQH